MPNTVRQIQLPSFSSVSATGGGTATLQVPVGPRYHMIGLKHTEGVSPALVNEATMKTNVTDVKVKTNGKVQRQFSATQALAIHAFRGVTYQTGFLPIFFSEPWRPTPAQQDALAWGTNNLRSFQIEVTLAASLQNVELEAFAIVDDVEKNLDGIVKWQTQTVPVTTTGTRTETNFPLSLGSYQTAHFFENADGDITNIRVQPDRAEAFDMPRADAEAAMVYMSGGKYAPQSAVFHLPWDLQNRNTQSLSTLRTDGRLFGDFRWEFEMANADDFTALFELLGTPN